MTTLSTSLYAEVAATLELSGRHDLVERLAACLPQATLTSSQAAVFLGLSSPNTVKNWLAGGYFPGAYQTKGGHWRFPLAEVEAVKLRLIELHTRNLNGDLAPPDTDDQVPPPLL